ncbi:hypothetical protein D4764_05G0002520 [Takifugu flavidus]|uniref:Uncharacterized protein n=1 Tax=Takifugu flavidus TaxID=433684 RepID=A0A5C6MYD8_9TELE|nr:hypothetical protein D4764_05G0002520 [Takifugu flavidus]
MSPDLNISPSSPQDGTDTILPRYPGPHNGTIPTPKG